MLIWKKKTYIYFNIRVRINKCMCNWCVMAPYLIKVVNTSFASVVIFDYDGLSLHFVAYVWTAVFRAQEQHIPASSGDVRDQCVRLRESKGGGEDRSCSFLEQMRGKLRLVSANCANQGQFPPEQLLCQCEWCEKIITSNDVSLEPFCHLQDHPHPLVDFCRVASCFACVHLQSPGVGRFDVTGCPNLYSIFGRLFWHVLPEAAPASEWDKLFIHAEVSVWAEQHRQALCPHIPDFAEGSQPVITASGSW